MESKKKDALLSAALSLPVQARVELVRALLLGLEPETEEPGAHEALLQEIEGRAREVDSGSAVTEEWSSVRERLLRRRP